MYPARNACRRETAILGAGPTEESMRSPSILAGFALLNFALWTLPVACAPVDSGEPNVPEFKPAFAGQTRAEEVKSKTQLEVTEIASGFDRPWAIAFLPDGRFLVTEKPTGNLYIVTREGK